MKQLTVIADMEGASGIFDSNAEACLHEELYPYNKMWRSYGRSCITSDVLAVCNAAIDAGIDDILLYDMHFAGCTESASRNACVSSSAAGRRQTISPTARRSAAMYGASS